jgi:hypothetical protein
MAAPSAVKNPRAAIRRKPSLETFAKFSVAISSRVRAAIIALAAHAIPSMTAW